MLQVLGRVYSKRANNFGNAEINYHSLPNIPDFDPELGTMQNVLAIEIKYGRVCIILRNDADNTDNWIKVIQCTRCGEELP